MRGHAGRDVIWRELPEGDGRGTLEEAGARANRECELLSRLKGGPERARDQDESEEENRQQENRSERDGVRCNWMQEQGEQAEGHAENQDQRGETAQLRT